VFRTTSSIARSLPTSDELARLGEAIHDHGVNSQTGGIRALVAAARGLGVSPVLCEVALDESVPEPVRERAAARLIRRVAVVSDAARELHPAGSVAVSA
jgi:hypothetical protein